MTCILANSSFDTIVPATGKNISLGKSTSTSATRLEASVRACEHRLSDFESRLNKD